MAPGPKKRSFHTPRNTKNAQASKGTDKKSTESQDEINKNIDINSNLSTDSDISQKDRYSKRGLETNWTKYEEPQTDPHADSMRGNDFNVLLSYSGGSGSQLKLQDEKEWDDEFTKDLSLDIQDLICAMKCIPFHERIGLKNVFDDNTIMNFVSIAKNHEMSYKPLSKSEISEDKINKNVHMEPVLNIVEDQGLLESDDDDDIPIKSVTVQNKTEDIINSLASNLSFKTFSESVDEEKSSEPAVTENKKLEATSNDLDFLLSLNISSKLPVTEEKSVAKNTNVDDWLNSILDD